MDESVSLVEVLDKDELLPSVTGYDEGSRLQGLVFRFLATHCPNTNTRETYRFALEHFFAWAAPYLPLSNLKAEHISGYIQAQTRMGIAIPSQKLRLSAIRQFFRFCVVLGEVTSDPSAFARTDKFSRERGETPAFSDDDLAKLFSIFRTDSLRDLRDRALLGTMFFTFARVSAVTKLLVEDFHLQRGQAVLRLHEKGGKIRSIPVHDKLWEFLQIYLERGGLERSLRCPLFPSMPRRSERLTDTPLTRDAVFYIVRRRCQQAGLREEFGCHSFRATSITQFLGSGGALEQAQKIAGHASPQTTKLYDRSLDENMRSELSRLRIDYY